VDDTTRGFMAIADSDASVGEVINIGSNFEVSIERLAELIAEVMAVDISITCKNERIRPEKSEVDRLYADIGKAKRLLSWEPAFGGLEGFKKGLQRTATWFSREENLSLYKPETYTL